MRKYRVTEELVIMRKFRVTEELVQMYTLRDLIEECGLDMDDREVDQVVELSVGQCYNLESLPGDTMSVKIERVA